MVLQYMIFGGCNPALNITSISMSIQKGSSLAFYKLFINFPLNDNKPSVQCHLLLYILDIGVLHVANANVLKHQVQQIFSDSSYCSYKVAHLYTTNPSNLKGKNSKNTYSIKTLL